MFEFEPCASCTSPMACRDRNYCNADEAAHWNREADRIELEQATVEVMVGDKVERRAAYFETANDLLGIHPRGCGVSMRRLKPQLRAGEQLMETIDGKFIIVQGVLPRAELPTPDDDPYGNGGW